MQFTIKELNRMIEIVGNEKTYLTEYIFPTKSAKNEEIVRLEMIYEKLIKERSKLINSAVSHLRDEEDYAMRVIVGGLDYIYLNFNENLEQPEISDDIVFYSKSKILQIISYFNLDPYDYNYILKEE